MVNLDFSIKRALEVAVIFACAIGVGSTAIIMTNNNNDRTKSKNDGLWSLVDKNGSTDDNPGGGNIDKTPVSKTESQVGKYADIDGDGTVDGIIFADLLIDKEIWHLHVAIDDADGKIVGAYFDYQETLKGYYNVLHQILTNHGIPALFYTDKRTVFEYKRKDRAFDDEDTFTQFSYACHNLGIDIKTTSVPQAKGRVERLNQTLQSRLPVELKYARITNIEDANKFLNSYIKKFNDLFALQLNTNKSVYEKQPDIEEINHTLAVLSPRKIDAAHCIRFKNRYYLPTSNEGTKRYFNNKTDCMVIEAFDGSLFVNILDTLYLMEEVPEHERFSKEFDDEPDTKVKKVKKINIPPMSHPWKRASYNNYVQKQKHRSGANV